MKIKLLLLRFLTLHLMPLLVGVASVSVSVAAAQSLPVKPFVVSYTVHGKGFALGEGSISLHDEGRGRYRMEARVEPNALVALLLSPRLSEHASGTFEPEGPKPQKYRSDRSDGRRQRINQLHFDWRRGTVEARYNDERATLRLEPRTLDPLSLYLQVMWDLQRGQQRDRYSLISRTKLRSYRVTAQGMETLVTPIGQLKTLRFNRSRPGDRRSVSFWFAPELDYLPVQIIQLKDGTENLRLLIKALDR